MLRSHEQGVYTISVAAELSGVHPQTLRMYDRKGLVGPDRSVGGFRRYSRSDLQRVRHVQELTEAGVNLEGVRRILKLEEEVLALRRQADGLRSQLRSGRQEAEAASGMAALVPLRAELVPLRAELVPFDRSGTAAGRRAQHPTLPS